MTSPSKIPMVPAYNSGYAAYQRMQTRITSIGNRIPFTTSL